jgi:hypothetical protein
VPADGLIKTEANPPFCDLQHFRSVTTLQQANSASARTPTPKMLSFLENSVPAQVRLRLTCRLEYGLRPALRMIAQRAYQPTAITPGVDKARNAEKFVNELRSMNVTPHVAQTPAAVALRLTDERLRHGSHAVSLRVRKRIKQAFGWIRTVAEQEKPSFRGRGRVAWAFTFAATARALVRLSKLIAKTPDLMATVPGFAKDFVGRWRQGKSDGESLLGLSRAS